MNALIIARKRDRQIKISQDKEFEENYCYYCGRELKREENNNAEDYGLHSETANKSCCPTCNKLITITDRHLSCAIERDGYVDKTEVEQAIHNLQELLEALNKCDAENRFVSLYLPDEDTNRLVSLYRPK